MKKRCLYCKNFFEKPYSCSIRNWTDSNSKNFRKCCSKECQGKYRKGNKEYISKLDLSGLELGRIWWKGKKRNKPPWNKGKKMSEETKKKVRYARALQTNFATGPSHWNWKGGVTELTNRLRSCCEYREWRTSVYERDRYICQVCGVKGGKLVVDHIIPFCVLLHESKMKDFATARFYKPFWDLDNGQTLCRSCHRKTETFGMNALYIMNKVRQLL